MENVTFIFNRCSEICENNTILRQRLQAISGLLEKEAGVILSFCERIGNRWKYLCGSNDFITPFYKYDNNKGYGIMVQDWGKLESQKEVVIEFLFKNCI